MEPTRAVVQAGVAALARLGVPLDPRSSARLVGHLEAAQVDCDAEFTEIVAGALLEVTEEPDRLIGEFLANADKELCRDALRALREARAARHEGKQE